MTGTIYRINPQRGMVAILTETDGFSVFELLSEIPLEIGDEESGSQIHHAAELIL